MSSKDSYSRLGFWPVNQISSLIHWLQKKSLIYIYIFIKYRTCSFQSIRPAWHWMVEPPALAWAGADGPEWSNIYGSNVNQSEVNLHFHMSKVQGESPK